MSTIQEDLDAAIDTVLDLIEQAEKENVELDPLQTIVARMQARGGDLNLDDAPPLMKMLLGGMLG
jgi:hypothetical protein